MHRFFACYLVVPDLLRRVIGCAADAEFYQRCKVVEHVDLVIDAGILRIGSRRTFGIGAEAGVLDRIIITLLWVPRQVVAKIVNLDIFLAQILRAWRDIGGEVIDGEIGFLKDTL